MKEIAVGIMFCNKAEQTIECLKGLKGCDVYLLNNGSHPEATELVEDYIRNKHIHYIKQDENTGVSRGRNTLIKEIKNDWILFIDNDITIKEKDWVEIWKKARDENPDILAFAPNLFNKQENEDAGFWNFKIVGNKMKFERSKDGYSNKICGGAVIVNKKLFDEVGLYDEEFFVGLEDYELSVRAMRVGRQFRVKELKEITLVHDHRKGLHEYDNAYLKVRYSNDKITESVNRMKKLYGLETQGNPLEWSKKQIEKMEKREVNESGYTKKVVLYACDQGRIGGIETFNANWCKRMSRYYDVTFVCDRGDQSRLLEMSEYCTVVVYTGQDIDTDICVLSSAWGKRPVDKIHAKEYWQMVHADYEWCKTKLAWKYEKLARVSKHICVGEHVKNQFKKATGLSAIVVPNLLDDEVKVERVLRLITVTRLGKEKGFARMKMLAEALRKAGKKFIWFIYGSGEAMYSKTVKEMFVGFPEVIFMGATTDSASYVADCDYLVALSDTEGFSYSTYEALQVGTPVICTNYPSAYEQVEDGKSGYILDMKLSNLDVEKICTEIPNKFKFVERTSDKDWIKLLGEPDPKYKQKPKVKKISGGEMKVKAKIFFSDIIVGIKRKKGEEFLVSRERGEELANKNIVEILGLIG
jgi:GT2 family glycosyltransferase